MNNRDQDFVSLLTEDCLAQFRELKRPRSGFFHDVLLASQNDSRNCNINVSPKASQLITKDHQQPSKSDKVQDDKKGKDDYHMKLSMIMFDKKKNYIEPKGKMKQSLVRQVYRESKMQNQLKTRTNKQIKQRSLAALTQKLKYDSMDEILKHAGKVISDYYDQINKKKDTWDRQNKQLKARLKEQQQNRRLQEQNLKEQRRVSNQLRNTINELNQRVKEIKEEKFKFQQALPLYKELQRMFPELQSLKMQINYKNVEDRCLKLIEKQRISQQQKYKQWKIGVQSKKIKQFQAEKKQMERVIAQKMTQIAKFQQIQKDFNRQETVRSELDELKSIICVSFLPYCKLIKNNMYDQMKNPKQIDLINVIRQFLEDCGSFKIQKKLQKKNVEIKQKQKIRKKDHENLKAENKWLREKIVRLQNGYSLLQKNIKELKLKKVKIIEPQLETLDTPAEGKYPLYFE